MTIDTPPSEPQNSSTSPKTGGTTALEPTDTPESYAARFARRVYEKAVKSANLFFVKHKVTPDARAQANGHYGGVLWLTGLSGSGKSTIAMMAEYQLFHAGYQVFVLDGDNQRMGVSSDLGFSPADRSEHIRRVGEIASLFAKSGFICIASFISPYEADRARARDSAKSRFHEIYVSTPLDVCESRDPKGLYKKARAGEIKDFTGIDAPYEPPKNAELVIDTSQSTVEDSVQTILTYVEKNFVLESLPVEEEKETKLTITKQVKNLVKMAMQELDSLNSS